MTDRAGTVRRGVAENAALLYRTARYVLGDAHEAEDAAQEAAIAALAASDAYDPARPVGPWLAAFALRCALARRSREARMKRRREGPNGAPGESPA